MHMTMETVKPNAPTGPFRITPGTWGGLKVKLKNKFAQLTDADLAFEDGKEHELSSRLQARLKKSEMEVRDLITAING